MTYRSPESIIRELIELASQGGNLLLNISPMGDGSIPEAQQKTLLAVGEWLQTNGEGIYGSRPWVRMGEGPGIPTEAPGDWKGGSTASPGPRLQRPRPVPLTEANFRFTTAKSMLFAFGYKYPQTSEATLRLLAASRAKIARVDLLGGNHPTLRFRQTADGLVVSLPPSPKDSLPYVLRIQGTWPIASSE